MVEQSLRKGKVEGPTPPSGSRFHLERRGGSRYNLGVKQKQSGANSEFTIEQTPKLTARGVVWNQGSLRGKMESYMGKKRGKYRTRLVRKESQRMVKQSIALMVLTLAVVIALIIFGIPAMIKLVGFLGELRSASSPVDGEDTIAPFAPQLEVAVEATASAKINVDGFAESGASVKLFRNGGQVAETTVGDEGKFLFEGVVLDPGRNDFSAMAVDSAGNESERSVTRAVVFDNKSPKLTVTSPENGAVVGDSLNNLVNVEGESEPDVEVYVNDRLAIVDGAGKFSQKVSLQSGDNEIVVQAVDLAGNTSTQKLNVRYEN